jgi:hypothetical protein
MSATNCDCACPNPEIVEIPGAPGEDGAAGDAGTNGVNCFTTVLAPGITLPAINATVGANLADASFLVVGQNCFASDGTHKGSFEVVSGGSTSVVLKFLGYYNDSAPGQVIAATTGTLTASGPQPASPVAIASGGTSSTTATTARSALGIGGESLTVYASGTSYQLTATPAQVVFGTTSPSLTITSSGVWLLLARARVDYTGSTFAAVRTGALKLRRTNNTAADIASATAGFLTDIITTLTYTLVEFDLPPVVYTTTNATDIIQLYGSISVIPTAGSIDISEAAIVAVKLYDQTV